MRDSLLVDSPSKIEDRVINGLCGICQAGCGVRIYMKRGRISRLAPLKGHPQSICCLRGAHAAEIVYSPDRLLYPLKRTGPRGTDRFERISWDEALDTIASRLKNIAQVYGPQAVCIYTGRGTFELSLCELLTPAGLRESSAWSLLFPFGSPNTTGAGAICYMSHGIIAPVITYGVYKIDTFIDIENSDLVVVWGSNPATCSPPLAMIEIKKAQENGARVIVIDHRRTETARVTGGRWIGICPGTDGALALGMIRVVIEEDLYDHEFVEKWTIGFEELKEYVAGFTPEAVEEMTRVPAGDIRQTARTIAGARGASLISYSGFEYSYSAVQNIRASLILWAITGNLDVPGGNVIKMPKGEFKVNRSRRLEPPEGVDPIGKEKYPIYHLYRKEAQAMELPEAILNNKPYPLRAMLVIGASILTAYPNPELWRKSFSALDFLVVVDRFLTGDAMYADIVLPAATAFEYEGYLIYDRYVQIRKKVIEPLGEARSDWDIASSIADRLGYGHLFPGSSEEMLRWAFEGTELDPETLRRHPDGLQLPVPGMRYRKWELGLLRRDGKPGFETPSGKFEIASSILAKYSYNPLPVYYSPKEGPIATPELSKKYPLIFNSGARNKVFFNSQHHNIPGLLKMYPRPLVSLHPEDAGPRNIKDGDTVFVISPRGRVRYTARVTEDIMPGVVEADAHGGSPVASPAWRETNVNELTDFYNRDPISGFPLFKALLCEVVKA